MHPPSSPPCRVVCICHDKHGWSLAAPKENGNMFLFIEFHWYTFFPRQVADKAKKAAAGAKKAAEGAAKLAKNAVKEVKDLAGDIKDGIEDAADKVKDGVVRAADKVRNAGLSFACLPFVRPIGLRRPRPRSTPWANLSKPSSKQRAGSYDQPCLTEKYDSQSRQVVREYIRRSKPLSSLVRQPFFSRRCHEGFPAWRCVRDCGS